MKKILVDQCLQCWHCDDDTYHCRETGEKLINPYQVPADCPLPDDLPESKESGWIPVSERLPEEKEVGKKVLVWRRLNESQSSLNPSIYNTNMVKHCDTDALWQPLPPAPQEKGETK